MRPAWRVLRLAEKTETFDDCFLLWSVAGLGLLKSGEVRDADLFGGGGATDQQKRRDANGEQRGGEMGSSLIILWCHLQSSRTVAEIYAAPSSRSMSGAESGVSRSGSGL